MSLLIAQHLYKSFGEKVLLNDVALTIESKERIGLVGVNGTGKSSLLRLLAGLESPDEGTITHANQFSVAFVDQDPVFEEDITVFEYIFRGDAPILKAVKAYEAAVHAMENEPNTQVLQDQLFKAQTQMDELEAWDAQVKAKTILTKLGVRQFSTRVKQLSGGQLKRVALARAFIQPADVLILDEPTNHLDHETVEWLEKYLKSYEGALLMVTHDRYFLDQVAETIFEMDGGDLYRHDGNYATYLEGKAERLALEDEKQKKQANLLKREMAWLNRGARARSTKQKARKDRIEALKSSQGKQQHGRLEIPLLVERLGNDVIDADNISFSYDDRAIVHQFSLSLQRYERLGIVGENGAGKTTLLRLLARDLTPDEGFVSMGTTVRLGFYTQNHPPLPDDLKVIDYVREVAEVIRTVDGEEVTAEQMLERFLFPRSTHRSLIRYLSGGEKKRLYLLNVLLQAPNVLFLDEPTNDLDTETLGVLESYLDAFPGTVVTVTHDRYFLDRVVDHILWAKGDGQWERLMGGYTEWREAQEHWEKTNASEAKPDIKRDKKRKKMSYLDQQEWARIEDDISLLEEEVEQLTSAVAEAGDDAGKAQELYAKQLETEERLTKAYERWEELAQLASDDN
ncbi:ABC-F family ATP-binding cassette domain-containing protein [Bacillaceae bacterium SIJ1]|uniref:ABC-F family ATP-binding cassette domain-containing protein n=1 Tax=Litoribacterium kuwaitense TaxID=1398745 RepID=UPI0013EBD6E7|nr:ABC-F family ATP-binding cassette domain-containing protein [Litoribacterium kuwaitense]NGP45063.1 ABC-F family ATP-binding cassette domain-containing protein [Litoribacterium kuwaitense]